jgi:hypothetical protein
MPEVIVKQALGPNGSIEVDESSGTVTLSGSFNEQLSTLGIGVTASLGVTLGGPALLTAWANGTSNAMAKAALLEAAKLVAALPA